MPLLQQRLKTVTYVKAISEMEPVYLLFTLIIQVLLFYFILKLKCLIAFKIMNDWSAV